MLKMFKIVGGLNFLGKVISIVNQKGGVGKTTTAVNLAAAVGLEGKKVLLIDFDSQGNSTSGLGLSKKQLKFSAYDVLMDSSKIDAAIVSSNFKNLDVIGARVELAAAEVELVEVSGRESLLKQAIIRVKKNYDFIFIDCPPSLGLLTLNALTASDSVLIPLQCEYYALEGLSQLMYTVRQVKKLYNSKIEIEGVLLTMFDGRLKLTMQVVSELKQYFSNKIYKTVVPKNVRLSEAPSFGEPVSYYDRRSKGALSYQDLASEFLSFYS